MPRRAGKLAKACGSVLVHQVDTATNLMITANDLDDNTQAYCDYLSQFTGKTKEEARLPLLSSPWALPPISKTFPRVLAVLEGAAAAGKTEAGATVRRCSAARRGAGHGMQGAHNIGGDFQEGWRVW